MTTPPTDARSHCAYCGRPLAGAVTSERFGERFCSETHAEEFVAGVRTARMQAVAGHETGDQRMGACAIPPVGPRRWSDYLKRGLCWSAPLLVLIALPLIWSGGWAATGGSLLTIVALLACPLGMYFMMRAMMGMPHQHEQAKPEREKGDAHA